MSTQNIFAGYKDATNMNIGHKLEYKYRFAAISLTIGRIIPMWITFALDVSYVTAVFYLHTMVQTCVINLHI